MPNDVTLTGRRVTLRPPQAEDAEEMFEALTSDPEVTRYLSWTPHPDADETRRVITELFNTADDPTWVIELRDTGQLIGTCGWRRPVPHAVSLGYCLGRRWWGQGLMSEAAGLLVEAARSVGVPGRGALSRRQRGVGGRDAALRARIRRQTGAVRGVPQSRSGTPGLLVVRKGCALSE